MLCPTWVLKVDGLPSVVSKNRLITFFRNEHAQDGGPVDDVIMSEDGSNAVVIFKEPEAVERVLIRGHTATISHVVVRVSPVYDYDQFKVDSSSRPQSDSDNKINSPTAQLAKPQFTNWLARIVALQARQSNSQVKQNNSQAKHNNPQAKQSSLNSPLLIIGQNSEPVINVCEKREIKGETEHSYDVERVLIRGHTVTISNVVVRVGPVYDYDKFRVDNSSRPQSDSNQFTDSSTGKSAVHELVGQNRSFTGQTE